MSMLTAENLTVRYGPLTVLDGLSFSLEAGDWLMLVGPNGAGKSTVINALTLGVNYDGSVRLEDRDIRREKPKQLARSMGVLSQNHQVAYGFTVGEIVGLGRYAYSQGLWNGGGRDDEDMVRRALALTGLTELKDRSALTLSGGELQRAFLAQVFAQDPKVLLLDEPTNHLDLVYQKQIFALIQDWLKAPGRAVLSVVHDLSLAKAYGSHALLLNGGHTVAVGPVEQVLRRDTLEDVYQMDVYDWMRNLLSQWEE